MMLPSANDVLPSAKTMFACGETATAQHRRAGAAVRRCKTVPAGEHRFPRKRKHHLPKATSLRRKAYIVCAYAQHRASEASSIKLHSLFRGDIFAALRRVYLRENADNIPFPLAIIGNLCDNDIAWLIFYAKTAARPAIFAYK